MPLNFSSHTQADYCCSYFNIRQFYTGSPHIFAVLFCTLCPSMVNIMYETYKVRESVWIKAFTQISQANTQPYYLRFLRVHIPLELQQYLQFCQKISGKSLCFLTLAAVYEGQGHFLGILQVCKGNDYHNSSVHNPTEEMNKFYWHEQAVSSWGGHIIPMGPGQEWTIIFRKAANQCLTFHCFS